MTGKILRYQLFLCRSLNISRYGSPLLYLVRALLGDRLSLSILSAWVRGSVKMWQILWRGCGRHFSTKNPCSALAEQGLFLPGALRFQFTDILVNHRDGFLARGYAVAVHQMLDKIAQGRLNKFYQEATLLEQAFIKDAKMSIQQYLKSINKDLTATAFKRVTLNVD